MYDKSILELMVQRRKQVLVHSILYYKMGTSLISDQQWNYFARELYELNQKHPDLAEMGFLAKEFKGFDPSSGYDLPLNDKWGVAKAQWLLEYRRGQLEKEFLKPNSHKSKEDKKNGDCMSV